MIRQTCQLAVAALLIVGGIDLAALPSAQAAAAEVAATAATSGESGLAAVYSSKLDSHPTASGQIYNPQKLTAAHKTLPFGTKVKVTNVKNGKSVIVRINDRGPKQAGRVLDLTPRAAHALGIKRLAMGEVTVEVQN